MPAAPAVTLSAAAFQAHLSSRLQLGGACSPATPGLSLAQRLGLVPSPPRLTPQQWLAVELASRARGDSAGECSICCRSFKTDGQILLSCTHTFHQHCLAAWERYSGEQRCPLCRAAAFEKRRIDDAAQLWRAACATRIQAAWRGRLARQHYAALRRLLPPSHPMLRRRWCAERLEEGSTALVGSVDRGAAEVEALFAELDATRAACSSVFGTLSERCGRGGGEAGRSEAAAAAAAHQAVGSSPARPGGSSSSPAAASPSQAPALLPFDWAVAIDRCLQRDEEPECPICLASLGQLCSSGTASSRGGRRQRQRDASSGGSGGGLAMTSCSHGFHADCLSAFEAFAVASDLAPVCPVCRCAYQRLDLK